MSYFLLETDSNTILWYGVPLVPLLSSMFDQLRVIVRYEDIVMVKVYRSKVLCQMVRSMSHLNIVLERFHFFIGVATSKSHVDFPTLLVREPSGHEHVLALC